MPTYPKIYGADPPTEIIPADWLPGFFYRKAITIDNTQNSNTLTDYQVLVTLDTASLISANKMRSDCGDIRFTDSDGVTPLNYWIESGINTTATKIWVKVPNIPASSTTTIYVYYGNPNATSQSNGTATFDWFDDFSVDSRSKYTAINANLAYDATNNRMTITATNYPYGALVTGITLQDLEIYAVMAINYDGVDYWGGLIARSQSQTSLANVYELGDKPASTFAERPVIEKCVGGTRTQLTGQSNTQSTGTFYQFWFRVYGNNLWAMTNKTTTALSTTDTSFTTAGYFGFGACDSERGQMVVSFIRVRKYTYPEPTTSVSAKEYFKGMLTK
jgi:hypothetical protein